MKGAVRADHYRPPVGAMGPAERPGGGVPAVSAGDQASTEEAGRPADAGKVGWAKSVLERAEETGLRLDPEGNVVETAAG